jgi:competence protein ComEC
MRLKYLLGSLALIASLIWLGVFSSPSQNLHLVFCDVGQGDAILIQKGPNQILIDGGPGRKVLDCLGENMPFWDRTIEIIALTHPQRDHLEGLNYVVERYNVKYFLSGPESNQSASFLSLKSKIEGKKPQIQIINPYLGEKFKLAGIELETLWPERSWMVNNLAKNCELSDCELLSQKGSKQEAVLGISTEKDLNDFSLVFLLKYGSFKALLPGDADAGIQDEILLNNSSLGKVDLLKVPHHGAKLALRQDFLETIRPQKAIISVGKNSYGHPSSELISRLRNLGIEVRRTDLEGNIKLIY